MHIRGGGGNNLHGWESGGRGLTIRIAFKKKKIVLLKSDHIRISIPDLYKYQKSFSLDFLSRMKSLPSEWRRVGEVINFVSPTLKVTDSQHVLKVISSRVTSIKARAVLEKWSFIKSTDSRFGIIVNYHKIGWKVERFQTLHKTLRLCRGGGIDRQFSANSVPSHVFGHSLAIKAFKTESGIR
ncbi:hypothetical protein Tco_0484706 [Tanacetum coccineum]